MLAIFTDFVGWNESSLDKLAIFQIAIYSF